MSLPPTPTRLKLPDKLRAQLGELRSRVWRIKLTEALCGALSCVLAAYLVVFAMERWTDTPPALRALLLAGAAAGCALIPVALYRWVWSRRRLDQLARLLARKHPSVGDQLLGVIELVGSSSEQARSPALCEAAINQVAAAAAKRDFSDAVPRPRHVRRGVEAGLATLLAGGLLAAIPGAAVSTWERFLNPWTSTPRYTFARVAELPARLVVPHGEPFTVDLRLAANSQWKPGSATLRIGSQEAHASALAGDLYHFELPAQIDAAELAVRVGDATHSTSLEPTLRPELTSISAEVTLPEYLGRTEPQRRDVRGGAVSLVQGARAVISATANRDLASATVNGQGIAPAGATLASPAISVTETRKLELQWTDQLGLSGKEPFQLTLLSRADEPPSVACDDLPRQKVLLDTETLTFKVKSQDDFGVKLVGMDWQGTDPNAVKSPARGEIVLAGGGPDKETVELEGTFSAKQLGIEPQPLNVRIFTEDFFPGRERTYSPTYVIFVLNAEQHAIWLTEQLSKWHRQSMEVRDRELQLLETNRQIRSLTAEELDREETRRRIETQAAAERANGRRLNGLVTSGEDLVRQAMRNPEFGVEHLEKWAEMLGILKDISNNRMPSVADLLKKAAQSQGNAQGSQGNQGPMVGQVRASGQGSATTGNPGKPNPNVVPTLADIESSQQTPPNTKPPAPAPASNASPKFGLAQTMLMGASKGGGQCPAGGAMDEAIAKQQDLLAEFEKVADELNRILSNLEGSTLVKRLKAASRLQNKIAGQLGEGVSASFGEKEEKVPEPQGKVFGELARQESKSSEDVSLIMDDLASYFERRRLVKFREVLDEMRQKDVVGNLRQLGDEMRKESSLAIAQTEYWSDHLDRWAENLVDPSRSGC